MVATLSAPAANATGTSTLDWQVVEHDVPGGGHIRYEEPTAEFTVDGNGISLRVEKFERGDGRLQLFDNPKHLMISTRSFTVAADSVTSFSVEMAAENIGGDPDDYRSGFVSTPTQIPTTPKNGMGRSPVCSNSCQRSTGSSTSTPRSYRIPVISPSPTSRTKSRSRSGTTIPNTLRR